MKKKSHATLAVLVGTLLLMAVPTCYFIAEQNNPNDPKNLNEYMGLAVADTGQTLCYDDSGSSIACDENPSNYPRQDGFYANKPSARSFTGPTQHPTYTSDYTTKDNVTGLVWKTCAEGLTGSSCNVGAATAFIWENALNACESLNSLHGGAGYANINSWRLPTVSELASILNYGAEDPAIDSVHFPGTPKFITAKVSFWSSTTRKYFPGSAWFVNFCWAYIAADAKVGSGNYNARCVADNN